MNCCKLYLVPEDVIQTWRAEQREKAVDKPEETVTNVLDMNMSQLLDTPNLNTYDKEKLFSQELAKFLNMRKQQQQQQQQQQYLQMSTSLPEQSTSKSSTFSALEESILTSVPKTYRTKAAGLIQYLKSDPNISWDERGQLIIRGTKYPGTHMLDLIHDALRKRKKVDRPTGWQELSSHFAEHNVPRELIGNETWLKGSSSTYSAQRPAKSFDHSDETSSESYHDHPAETPTTSYHKTPIKEDDSPMSVFFTPRKSIYGKPSTFEFLKSTIKKEEKPYYTPGIKWENISEEEDEDDDDTS